MPVLNMAQYEISFFLIKMYRKVFYIQISEKICLKCETALLFFLIKTMV